MKRPSVWPEWSEDIWAKSPESKDDPRGESLAQHTWNVLERLAEAIRLRPDLPKTLGFPRLWHGLFWACFLHDFGKAAKGFQEMLRGGAKWPHRHEVLSLVFLDWITDTLSDEEQKWIAAAIVSHHRDQRTLKISLAYLFLSEFDEDPLVERVSEIGEETLKGLWRWLNECAASWIEALGLAQTNIQTVKTPSQTEAIEAVRRQGAQRVRYWLKTYHRFVRDLTYTEQRAQIIGTLALRGHLISSDHMASAHTGPLSPSPLVQPSDLLVRLGLKDAELYAHQKACVTTQGSVVLIAPTGSGKTESALLWACAQTYNKRPIPRLFYTLPYQASMNAMYDRLQDHFPQQVGLEHSRSTLALYRRLLDRDYTPQTAARSARWAKNLARLNYFSVRVLSPYQILKAAYRLKGYESLLSDYFGGVFVLDEVHAYETKRLAMILGTVKYLADHFGARFFVMSATLPSLLQGHLAEALGPYTSIRATPELFARYCRHTLFMRDGDLLADAAMASIAEAAHDGQAVMVCCNTVKRAQTAYDELQCRLKGDDIEVILLHGRFNGRDRLEKENVVRQATGSRSDQRRPIVLVATQVVEVSLDIDLDVIYTDPAPLEALIQRFGRINRRRLKKWAPVSRWTKLTS